MHKFPPLSFRQLFNEDKRDNMGELDIPPPHRVEDELQQNPDDSEDDDDETSSDEDDFLDGLDQIERDELLALRQQRQELAAENARLEEELANNRARLEYQMREFEENLLRFQRNRDLIEAEEARRERRTEETKQSEPEE